MGSARHQRLPAKLATALATGLAIGLAIAATLSPPAAALAPGRAGAGFGVNYYPGDGGWRFMWQRFSRATIARDFAAIHHSGARWVRIIVAPSVFGFPHPQTPMATRLADVLELASRDQLQVHLTLFDMFDSWSRIVESQAWARALLTPLLADGSLTQVEVRNEVNPADRRAVLWARALIPYLRGLTHRPISVSVSSTQGVAGLRRLAAQLTGVARPNVYEIHIYGGEAALVATKLALARAVVSPARIAVGEVGFSTAPEAGGPAGVPGTLPSLEAAQSVFLSTVALAARQVSIPMTVWTWSDFRPRAIPFNLRASRSPLEYDFGLVDIRGRAKPALGAVRTVYTTGRIDPSVNFGFEAGDPRSRFPLDWRIFDPRDGRGQWDTNVAHTGRASVRFSGTGRSGDALPSIFATPITPILAGHRYRLGVWARGRHLTGYTVGSVSWYAADGAFLSQSATAQLAPGDQPWTLLTVTAVAPPNTAFVQLHLKSANNAGSAWFDDVSFTAT